MIEVSKLNKSFGKNHVLRDVDLHVEKGEVVVIIGPSGSGKSTFLRCLNLLETPNKGSIIFEGNEITDKKVNINKLREKMGMVFQQFNLFPHKTVLENITIAPIKVKGLSVEKANEIAMEKASYFGSGWVSVCNTNHFGIASYYTLQALTRDMIGWAMTNTTKLAPTYCQVPPVAKAKPVAKRF